MMEINVTLHLPEQFCNACAVQKINDQEALQSFISKVLVFSFLLGPYDAPESLASTIFGNYINSLGDKIISKEGLTREIHFRYIKRVLKLISTHMDLTKKERAYRRLIEKWYAELNQSK